MKNIIAIIALSAFMLSSTTSLAEVVETSNDLNKHPRINNYINQQNMLQILFKVGALQDKKFNLYKDCKSQRKVRPISVFVTSPIDFPENLKNPKTGSWRYKFGYERCGKEKIYNAAFKVVKPGEPVSISTYFPGTSYASPQLIKDAAQAAIPIADAEAKLKNCKNHLIQDMKVIEKMHTLKEDKTTYENVWVENWLISVCGKLVDTEIVFVPNTKIGGIDFHTRKTTLR